MVTKYSSDSLGNDLHESPYGAMMYASMFNSKLTKEELRSKVFDIELSEQPLTGVNTHPVEWLDDNKFLGQTTFDVPIKLQYIPPGSCIDYHHPHVYNYGCW